MGMMCNCVIGINFICSQCSSAFHKVETIADPIFDVYEMCSIVSYKNDNNGENTMNARHTNKQTDRANDRAGFLVHTLSVVNFISIGQVSAKPTEWKKMKWKSINCFGIGWQILCRKRKHEQYICLLSSFQHHHFTIFFLFCSPIDWLDLRSRLNILNI